MHRRVTACPLYRSDLDLVVAAPGGEIVAFATVWFDPETLTGAFEPPGCVPEHRRRGLSRALIREGTSRLRELGATSAFVTTAASQPTGSTKRQAFERLPGALAG